MYFLSLKKKKKIVAAYSLSYKLLFELERKLEVRRGVGGSLLGAEETPQ